MAAKLEITMDAAQVEAAYRKLQSENAKLRGELGALTGAGTAAGQAIGASFREISRAAQQAKAAAAAPADTLRAEIAKLDAALKAGMVTPGEYGQAVDAVSGKLAAAAGPVDQYALRIEALRAKQAAGQITQAQYDSGLAASRTAAAEATDGAGRYQIALLDLQQQLASGQLSQAGYGAAMGELRAKTLAAAEPADAYKIKLYELGRQLDAGKLSASTYDAAVQRLTEQTTAAADPLTKMQVSQAALDDQLRRGVIDMGQHAGQTARLRSEYDQTAAPIDRYKLRLAEAEQQLQRGQITGRAYQQRVRDLREEFQDSTTTADRYRLQIEALQRAKQSGRLSAEQYARAVAEAQDQQEQLTTSAPPGLDAIAGRLTGIVTGMLSVGGIIAQIKAVMEEAKQLREEQAGKQMTVAEAQDATVKMLGAVDTPEATAFLKSVEDLGKQTGFKDMSRLYLAAADTLSATAGDQQLTLEILRQAAPLFKRAPQDIGSFAGAVSDLAKIQGSEGAEGIKGVISTVLSTTGQARITSLDAFKEAAQSIAGATVSDTGDDRARAVREAGAAFAAVGSSIKDPTGSQTKTAVAALARQLETLLPEKDVLAPVSDETRAKLLREQAQIQAKVAEFESGGDGRRGADLVKAQADLQASSTRLESLRTKADEERDPAKQAAAAAAAAQEAAKNQQLRARVDQMRAGMPAGLQADAAEMALSKQRLAAIERELSGVVREGTGKRTLAERIAAVQQDENLQRLFFQGDASQNVAAAAFEGPVKGVMRELLTNADSNSARAMRQAMDMISDDPKTYDQMVTNLREATPQLRMSEGATTAAAATEQFDIGADSRRATIEENAREALRRTRRGPLGWMDAHDETAMSTRMLGMDEDQAGEFAIAKLLMRREAIAGGGIRGRGLEREQSREINRFVGLEDQLRGDRLDRLLSIRGSEADQQRLDKLDASARQQVEYLDAMLAQLRQIAGSNQEMRDNEIMAPAVGASAAAAVPSPQQLPR